MKSLEPPVTAHRLRELAATVDVVGLSEAAEAFDIDRPAAEREISAALRTAADLIGPSAVAEGPYVAPCAHASGASSLEGLGEHAAHTPCKSPVFRSDRAAGEALGRRIGEAAGQDRDGVGRHEPSPARAPARLRDPQRGDDGRVRGFVSDAAHGQRPA